MEGIVYTFFVGLLVVGVFALLSLFILANLAIWIIEPHGRRGERLALVILRWVQIVFAILLAGWLALHGKEPLA